MLYVNDRSFVRYCLFKVPCYTENEREREWTRWPVENNHEYNNIRKQKRKRQADHAYNGKKPSATGNKKYYKRIHLSLVLLFGRIHFRIVFFFVSSFKNRTVSILVICHSAVSSSAFRFCFTLRYILILIFFCVVSANMLQGHKRDTHTETEHFDQMLQHQLIFTDKRDCHIRHKITITEALWQWRNV